MELGPVLTAEEVATLLQCSTEVVAERTQAGELPGLRFGRGWIFPTDALLARLNEMAAAEAQARRDAKGRSRTPPPMAVYVAPPLKSRNQRQPPRLPELPLP